MINYKLLLILVILLNSLQKAFSCSYIEPSSRDICLHLGLIEDSKDYKTCLIPLNQIDKTNELITIFINDYEKRIFEIEKEDCKNPKLCSLEIDIIRKNINNLFSLYLEKIPNPCISDEVPIMIINPSKQTNE